MTEHIIRQAVFPGVAGLEPKRYPGQFLHPVANRSFLLQEARTDASLDVGPAHPVIPVIGERGGVGEKVADGDGPLGGERGSGRRGLVWGIGRLEELDVREVRYD